MENKKQSSYQKMKAKYEAKIAELTADIHILTGEDNIRILGVKARYKLKEEMETHLWAGNRGQHTGRLPLFTLLKNGKNI